MRIKQNKARKIPNEILINLLVCNMQKADQMSDHSASDQGSVQANIPPLTAARSKDQGKTIPIMTSIYDFFSS